MLGGVCNFPKNRSKALRFYSNSFEMETSREAPPLRNCLGFMGWQEALHSMCVRKVST